MQASFQDTLTIDKLLGTPDQTEMELQLSL
jgi:hypothetical protein